MSVDHGKAWIKQRTSEIMKRPGRPFAHGHTNSLASFRTLGRVEKIEAPVKLDHFGGPKIAHAPRTDRHDAPFVAPVDQVLRGIDGKTEGIVHVIPAIAGFEHMGIGAADMNHRIGVAYTLR